jgi:nitrate reductase cytochrome c-type subunit
MDCHGARVKEPGGPTPVPESHYVDLRRGPGAPGERLAGARHVCVSCHLPQDDVRPLVGNTFAR